MEGEEKSAKPDVKPEVSSVITLKVKDQVRLCGRRPARTVARTGMPHSSLPPSLHHTTHPCAPLRRPEKP